MTKKRTIPHIFGCVFLVGIGISILVFWFSPLFLSKLMENPSIAPVEMAYGLIAGISGIIAGFLLIKIELEYQEKDRKKEKKVNLG